MDAVTMEGQERPSTGKGYARRLRNRGKLPSVVYGKEVESKAIEVPAKEMEKLINSYGSNALVKLKVGGQEYMTLIRDVQRHPVRRDLMHVDFLQISLKDKLQTTVPIHLVGEPEGAREGGILQHGIREVEIECLPAVIPDYFQLDVSDMNIGDTKTVADLEAVEGVEVLSEPNSAIATVVPPRMEEEPETEEEEVVGAEVPTEAAPEGEAAQED